VVAGAMVALLAACQDPAAPAGVAMRLAAEGREPGANAAAAPRAGDVIPDEYIVTFRDDVADAPGLARQLVAQHGGTVRFTYTAALRGFAARLPAPAVEALQRNPLIAAVEPDAAVRAEQLAPSLTTVTGAAWNLDRLDQRALPLDSAYRFAYTGAGVTAYIFDSGIRYDHVEFSGRAVPGFDAVGDGRNGNDCYGHGTHVAGIVGGSKVGVAKQVRLVSVRVMGCDGVGWSSWVYAGMDWVIKNKTGPALANFSIGRDRDETYNQAMRNLLAAGVQAAIAAGNASRDACLDSPGSTSEAVTVAASNAWDARSTFSNWGSCVDVFAPGNLIRSAMVNSSTDVVTMSGTSMAAPHVAGVMALYLEQTPALTAAQLQQLVVANATQNVITNAQSNGAHLIHAFRSTLIDPIPLTVAPTTSPTPTTTSPSTSTAAAPSAPTNATLRLVTLTRVDVSWTDKSTEETSFQVERREGSGSWTLVANVAANTTTHSDQTVARDRTYSYRIRAANEAGTSGYTNEPSVATTCTVKRNSLTCR
jgi:subtilisin family serine protease